MEKFKKHNFKITVRCLLFKQTLVQHFELIVKTLKCSILSIKWYELYLVLLKIDTINTYKENWVLILIVHAHTTNKTIVIYVFEIKPICCLKALHTATITKWLFVCDIKATTILDLTRLHVLLFLSLSSDLLHWSNLQQTSINKLDQRWFKSHPYSLMWWRRLTIMHLGCWMRFRQMFSASGSFHNHEPLNRWWNHTNRGDSNWEGCGERRSPPNPRSLNELCLPLFFRLNTTLVNNLYITEYPSVLNRLKVFIIYRYWLIFWVIRRCLSLGLRTN